MTKKLGDQYIVGPPT